ncbi:MAG TPA: multiheme c-type cytochrome [Terriglobales bacterium]|jgi:predicted CXXCH cytochrome family protein|nr:multiheme c-type cytochrome [Terriglobales bacterium]
MKHWKIFLLSLLIVAIVAAFGATALMRRGFRATTEPSSLEKALARTVRNLAIPHHARNETNPWTASSENLSEAREHFIARCAICHGNDGRGQTQMGRNLYPRVPDLLSPKTQNLTDGEIHYIIENGVQLTGMPARRLAHQETEDDSWKLVLFIRNLHPLTPAEQSRHINIANSAHYAGSQACEKCHAEIYEHWKKTPMANIVRDPREHPDAIIPNLATNSVAKFTKDQIAFVYGSIWKQRYFTKIGDDYFPLPAQWEIKNHAWSRYFVSNGGDWWASFYPPDNMQRPTGPTCDGCHSMGYDIHTKKVAEWNVGCERCHGPGSEHVAHPSRANILNPARMNYVAASDTCIQCHSQGRPVTVPIEGKYYDWPVGYNVGLRLQDFWKLEDHTLDETSFYYFADRTAHKNRMQGNDFVQSVMYLRGVTCFSCHDAHGTDNYAQLRKPAEKICLDCHGPLSPNGPRTATLEEHTHHKDGSPGSQCVFCHMPAIATEGVPGTFVHAHTFRFITPGMTDKYKIPNPCTSCHTDKSTAWATEALRHWPERSPWRIE